MPIFLISHFVCFACTLHFLLFCFPQIFLNRSFPNTNHLSSKTIAFIYFQNHLISLEVAGNGAWGFSHEVCQACGVPIVSHAHILANTWGRIRFWRSGHWHVNASTILKSVEIDYLAHLCCTIRRKKKKQDSIWNFYSWYKSLIHYRKVVLQQTIQKYTE